MLNNLPLIPIAKEDTAIRAGPTKNLAPMAKAAFWAPHAMILGCNAMKRPVKCHKALVRNKKVGPWFLHIVATVKFLQKE